jgi:hypothetical protein
VAGRLLHSRVQIPDDGHDATVMLVAVGWKIELHEDAGDVFLDRARRDHE